MKAPCSLGRDSNSPFHVPNAWLSFEGVEFRVWDLGDRIWRVKEESGNLRPDALPHPRTALFCAALKIQKIAQSTTLRPFWTLMHATVETIAATNGSCIRNATCHGRICALAVSA